jgi:hypothetical protein
MGAARLMACVHDEANSVAPISTLAAEYIISPVVLVAFLRKFMVKRSLNFQDLSRFPSLTLELADPNIVPQGRLSPHCPAASLQEQEARPYTAACKEHR